MLITTVIGNYKDADPTANNQSVIIGANSVSATTASSSPRANEVDVGLPKLAFGFRGTLNDDQLSRSGVDNPSGLPIGLLLNNQHETVDQGYLTRAPVLPPIGPVFASSALADRRASFPFSRTEHTGDNQDFHRRPLAPYKHPLLPSHHESASGQLHMQHPLLQPHTHTQRALYSSQSPVSLLPLPSLFQPSSLTTENYSAVPGRYIQQQALPPPFTIPQLLSRYSHCGYQADAPENAKFQQEQSWSQETQENRVARRFRRRYNQIERRYACSYPNCTKSYGLLNHLNTHIVTKKHGSRKAKADFQTSYFHANYSPAPYPVPIIQTDFAAAGSPPFTQANKGYALVHANRLPYLNACGLTLGPKNDAQKLSGEEANAATGKVAWSANNGCHDSRGGRSFLHHPSQAGPCPQTSSQQGMALGTYRGINAKCIPAQPSSQSYPQTNGYGGYHAGPGALPGSDPPVSGHTWQEPRQPLSGGVSSTLGYDTNRST